LRVGALKDYYEWLESPASLFAQAKNWSVVKARVAVEGSRELSLPGCGHNSGFYWLDTLEIYPHKGHFS
jgi:hypothetical protein